ncbi:MAG: type I 3-dehydroquinate dehydratase [Nitrososphaerota archaeon]
MKKPFICVSTYGEDADTLAGRVSRALRKGADLVEARLDYLEEVDLEKLVKALTPYASKTIITIRPVEHGGLFKGTAMEKNRMLDHLSRISPALIDLELDYCELQGLKPNPATIVSWHDFAGTPPLEKLADVAERCLGFGGYAKVVTLARSRSDILRILHLYSIYPKNRLIAFCMGEMGRISRLLAMAAGSPIAYASLDGMTTAAGQMSLNEMMVFRERLVRGVSTIYEEALLPDR